MEEKLVSFILGPKASYSPADHMYAIYFATDTKEMLVNNISYGLSTEALAALENAIADKVESVEFVAPDTIKITDGHGTESYIQIPAVSDSAVGLMTPEQKAALEKVVVDLAQEVSDRTNADATLQGNIDAETQLREGADEALQSAIDAEAATRKTEDEALDAKIEQVKADAKSYSVAALSEAEVLAAGSNVKEGYKLVDEDGVQSGASILIYKDSSLISVRLEGQTLFYKYVLVDGTETEVGVDVSAFLHESEFADGLQVVDHKVSVKKDAESEAFLSVSPNGVKVSGVQSAIDAAVAAEKTRAEAAEKANSDAIAAETAARAAADTAIEDAYKAAVAAEETRAKAAEEANAASIAGEKERALQAEAALQEALAQEVIDRDAAIAAAKALIDAYTVNGKAVSANPILNGGDIALTNYAGVTGGNVVATDTVNSAIQKMETRLVWKELN